MEPSPRRSNKRKLSNRAHLSALLAPMSCKLTFSMVISLVNCWFFYGPEGAEDCRQTYEIGVVIWLT
jgi:hypothetical protein